MDQVRERLASAEAPSRETAPERTTTIRSGWRDVSTFAGGNVAITALGLVTAVLQSRFVDPGVLGAFKQYGIMSAYLVFLNAGTFDVMAREYPYLLGSGQPARADAFAASCQGWIVAMTALSCTLFAGLGVRSAWEGDAIGIAGWVTQLLVMTSSLYGGYLATTFRTAKHFATLTKANVAGAVVGFGMLPALWLWPFAGLCLKTSVSAAVPLWLLFRHRPLRMTPRWEWRTIGSAIRAGIPLSAIGYADNALARAVEATIVLKYLGEHALGLFALTQTAYAAILVIPLAVGSVYLPRLAHAYGRTHRTIDLLRMSAKPTALTFMVMSAAAGAAWFAADPVVRIFAPKYVEAIPPIRMAGILGPIWALRIPSLALYASGRTAAYGVAVMSGVMAFVAGAIASVNKGWGLVGMVAATAAAGLVRAAVSGLVLYVTVRERDVDVSSAGRRF